jgi:hypothetical protein
MLERVTARSDTSLALMVKALADDENILALETMREHRN